MSHGSVAARLIVACIAGFGLLVGAARVDGTRSEPVAETLVLLLADRSPTAEATPSASPPGPGEAEVIVDSRTVPGVEIQGGLLMRPVHADADGRSFSIVEWPAEISLRRHWHPVTERLWMLEGSIESASGERVEAAEFWEAPAGVAMGPFSSTGSVFVFLGEGPFETHYLEPGESAPRRGAPAKFDPDTIPWVALAAVTGGTASGEVKVLRLPTETDRGVYLVRLMRSATPSERAYRANVEGYVLSGSLRLSDPYHGAHVLSPGHYFRIPAGSPFGLSSAP
ncbi:MAG TPA: DUF4437 domain-containing protein [Longimicrobiales bacterium]|nr:DUF4437 domain-containing protein [Longimicrobiales bacterium]